MIENYAATIAEASAALGRRVSVDPGVLDRDLPLAVPGRLSANRRCRLVEAGDGWIAVNLPRECDVEMIPAWLGRDAEGDSLAMIARCVPGLPVGYLVDRARLLGMAVAAVGETRAAGVRRVPMGVPGPVGRRVLDLSSLWAGPLCGSLLAAAGFDVTKLESATRRDPVAAATPLLAARLNGAKAAAQADFADTAALRAWLEASDIVISSARPRAFGALGIDVADWMAAAAGRIWIAVTAHGWSGAGSDRVGFGDDCAAAGGLVRWTAGGKPRFVGDAIADPLTGLAAAAEALSAVREGGGVLVDAALAGVAAEAAREGEVSCATW